jgi:RNA polymerase sigma-70 factor (ECF subfamily)
MVDVGGKKVGATRAVAPQPCPDVELLERWAAGDVDAGAILFERHADAVHRFFHCKVPHLADDLTQATLLACVEGAERLRELSSFRAYLFGIARNQLHHHFRRGHVERTKLRFNTTSVYDRNASPSSVAARQCADRMLQQAMGTLPIDMQILLELAYWEDLSAVELAEVLKIPENTVYSRLHRAKMRLKQALASLEGES